MLLNCGVGEDSWETLGLKPVNPKGNQSWIFIRRTIAEAEAPILWWRVLELMWRANSLEKTLMLGKIEGRKRRGWQRTRCLDSVSDSMDMHLSKLRDMVKDRETWRAAVCGIANSRTWLSNNSLHCSTFLKISSALSFKFIIEVLIIILLIFKCFFLSFFSSHCVLL